MPRRTDPNPNRTTIVVIAVVLAIVSLGLWYVIASHDETMVTKTPGSVAVPIQSPKVLGLQIGASRKKS